MDPHRHASGHILVVDDDRVSRHVICSGLELNGYVVTPAEGAREARRLVEDKGSHSFDALVTDYRMPVEDGISLMTWVMGADPSLATIMVTGEGEKKLLAESLHLGVFDFHEKPVDIARFSASVARAVQSTTRKRQLRSVELAVQEVARMQRALVQVPTPGLRERVDVCYLPKQQAGGDFVSVFPTGPEQFVIVATDVSGHDLRAAFVSSYFQGVVRGMVEQGARIDEVFTFFNTFLARDWNRPENWNGSRLTETSLAACAIQVDLRRRVAQATNCGFPIPLHYVERRHLQPLMAQGSSPLGWFPNPERADADLKIDEEGMLVLWSDGLEDIADTMEVDPHALAFALRRTEAGGEEREKILSRARDDVMSVIIDLSATRSIAKRRSVLLFQSMKGDSAGQIDDYQQFWLRSLVLAMPHMTESVRHDVTLCLREAVLNALIHGCRGSAEARATLEIVYCTDTAELQVRIRDPGDGHAFEVGVHHCRDMKELQTGRRGLMLINCLSDQIISQRRGADLILFFDLELTEGSSTDVP